MPYLQASRDGSPQCLDTSINTELALKSYIFQITRQPRSRKSVDIWENGGFHHTDVVMGIVGFPGLKIGHGTQGWSGEKGEEFQIVSRGSRGHQAHFLNPEEERGEGSCCRGPQPAPHSVWL